MATVLVTGASGTLGRVLVPLLVEAGHTVRAMTRNDDHAARLRRAGATAVVADLLGEPRPGAVSMAEAVAGADHVVHLATSPRKDTARTEVQGTAGLMDARDSVAPACLVTYLSIVGCDRTPMAYYRAKTEAEGLVRGRERTRIVRATQFHELLSTLVKVLPGVRRVMVPAGWLFQPVAVGDVAALLAQGLDGELPPEVGGPEVLTSEEVARRRTGVGVVPLPVPGKLSAAVRSGSLLPGPDATRGRTLFPRVTDAGA